jgi:2-dehydropantoate 2-reductase
LNGREFTHEHLILGAGGIGGYFGAHLIRAVADVTYLLRDQRKALIDAQGLRVETPQGAFVVQPRTVTAQDVQPKYDLILLAPKCPTTCTTPCSH